MNYLITPPNTHYDGGVGITASNFSNAAKVLKKNNGTSDGILPFCYLQRHAIELFLKSLIIILHKKYQLPFGAGFSEEKPAIKVNNKWKSIVQTHNISDLFHHFERIYADVFDSLPETTVWDLPDDIEKKINLISGADPNSTYFRYPDSTTAAQDSKKSSIQKDDISSMIDKITNSKAPMKCVMMLDENDDIVETYDINHSPIPHIIEALDELNEFFNNIHVAFRVELAGGT